MSLFHWGMSCVSSEREMKIALIGAQGVGKTTLSRMLMERFDNAYIVKETVRDCPYPVDQQADFKTEWWVLSHSILEEREADEKKFSLVIADRCLLDISVYTKLIQETDEKRISKNKRKLIDDVISRWLDESPYEMIFFLKVDPEIWSKRDLEDGFRSTDMGWYQTLTQQFELALDWHRIRERTSLQFVMNNGKIEDSFNQIIGAMEEYSRRKEKPLPALKSNKS